MSEINQFANSAAKRYAKILFKKLILKFIVSTTLIWGSALLIFLFAVLAYFLVYELPKQSILGIFDGNERDAAFEYGRNFDEEGAMQNYPIIASKWSEGLTEEQLSQVEPYALDWAWLAAVDRTLGDPEQSGKRDKTELVLDPEATFELVRPKFEWLEAEKKIEQEICEEITVVEVDEEGNEITSTHHEIRISVSYEPQILLKRAQTMQGIYVYSYRTESNITISSSSSPCGQLTTTETYLALSGISTLEGEWGPLKSVLAEHNIVEEDQLFLLEYWNEFLADLDGENHDPLPDGWMPTEVDLKWPLNVGIGRITSRYGMRIHPITGEQKLHKGVDIAAPKGTSVYAVADGEVIYAGNLGSAGLAVILSHEDIESRYYHLNAISIDKGKSVLKGKIVGEVGSTGASTGPHLHFETWVGGEPVDPLIYYGEGLER